MLFKAGNHGVNEWRLSTYFARQLNDRNVGGSCRLTSMGAIGSYTRTLSETCQSASRFAGKQGVRSAAVVPPVRSLAGRRVIREDSEEAAHSQLRAALPSLPRLEREVTC